MVAVREHGLSAELVEVGSGEETDIAMSADGHESWGVNFAVSGLDGAGAAEAIGKSFFDFEFHSVYYSRKMKLLLNIFWKSQ